MKGCLPFVLVAMLVAVFPTALAYTLYRAHDRLLSAVTTHWILCRHKSRRREDYNLWRAARLPIHCLLCGGLTADFLECDVCGGKQPFDDMPKSEA
jgi:hypothetical protein